jgi:hypothetical protein
MSGDNSGHSSCGEPSVDVLESTKQTINDTNGQQLVSKVLTTTVAIDDDWFVNTNPYKCMSDGCGQGFSSSEELLSHHSSHFTQDITGRPDTQSAANHMIPKRMKPQRKSYIVETPVDRRMNTDQRQSHRSDQNYMGLSSIRTLPKECFQEKVINGQKRYSCRYPGPNRCAYRSSRAYDMAKHLNCVHIGTRRFPCRQPGCPKVYLSPTALREHELNHLCGFGILDGRAMRSVCGDDSLNRFRQMVIVNTEPYYRCSFTDCHFQTPYEQSIRRHIHDQHVCPHRIP